VKVTTPDEKRFAKVLIFGPSGQGKTYLLGTAQADPRTYPMLLIDFEGGAETLAGLDIDVARIKKWGDYDQVYEALSGDHWTLDGSSLKKGERYRSVAIDSISETHLFALLHILDEEGQSRRDPELLEQRDYGKASVQMRRLLREFRDLELHVFYTAHAKEVEERGVGKVKVPALAGQMAEEVVGLMSIVGYLALGEDEEGEVFRVLVLQNSPQHRTKIRTPWGADAAPDEIDHPTVTNILDAVGVTDDGSTPEPIVDEEDNNEEENDEDEYYTWDELKSSKKAVLLDIVEAEGLDVDTSEKVADLRLAIAEALDIDTNEEKEA
jgi:hypothetical protein